MPDPKLAFVGCGRMGGAILSGLLRSGYPADRMFATVGDEPAATRLRQSAGGVDVGLDNIQAASSADVLVVALKPNRMRDVLDDDGFRRVTRGKLLISVAAGVRLESLTAWLPDAVVIRAMPNTACLIGSGMTVLSPGPAVTQVHMDIARRIFAAVSRVLALPSKHMDAITALNGSGPAFVYVMLDALADGAVRMGIPREIAVEIAAQMVMGSARMVLETGEHPAVLKDQVVTPGGTTIAGLMALEQGGFRHTLAKAVQEASETATRLGRPAKSRP